MAFGRQSAVVLLAAVLSVGVVAGGDGVSLDEYSERARNELTESIRSVLKKANGYDTVGGIVSCVGDDCFFIQGRQEGLKVFCSGVAMPKIGDVVTIGGAPSLEGGRVVFVADKWNRKGTEKLPPPRKVKSSELVSPRSDRGINWMLVEVEGRAMGLTESGFALEIDKLPVSVFAENLPPFLEHCGHTHPKVRIRGVAELILDQSSLFGRAPYVIGVRIRVPSARDIELLPDAMYLVACRDRRIMVAVAVVITLLVIMLAALIFYSLRLSRRQLRNRAVSKERKRMADDLHDTIEQHLVGAGMLLQLGRTKDVHDILLRAKKEMRDIVWGLKNDEMLRQSPAKLIQDIAHDETKKGICHVSARLNGLPDCLDASQMRDLMLIVREAIGNAIKHGSAKKIAISADPLPRDGWLLRIANDGTAFDSSKAPGFEEGHFGIEGMKSRARRLGAQWSIAVDGGWTVVSLQKPAAATASR